MRYLQWPGGVKGISHRAAWLGNTACVLLMITVVANVIVRFIWIAIPGTIDIAESLLVVMAAMALADTQAADRHISVDIVIKWLPSRLEPGIRLCTLILTFVIMLLLTWQSWRMGLDALKSKSYAFNYPNIPLYPFKLILAVGVSLFCLQLLADIFGQIRRLRSSKD
ncbi:TRAP transporter small permease subunit [Thermodesulfobacteriota bacterium]